VVRPVFFGDFAVLGKVIAGKDAYDKVWMEAFDFSRQLETIFPRQADVNEKEPFQVISVGRRLSMLGLQGAPAIVGVRLTKVVPMVSVHPLKIIDKELLLRSTMHGIAT
jgi:hypothetical protein